MLTAPLKLLVNLIARLPDAVRPGVFLAILFLIGWFVAVQRGLPDLWHATCRGAARALYWIVGIALLPDYLTTTARLKRGLGPGEAVLAFGGVAERLLDGTVGFYEQHQRESIEWKKPPWLPCLGIIVVLAIPWVVMDRLPATSDAREQLAKVYDRWRDVEAWADVDPSHRADPGISWPPRPTTASVRQRGKRLGVTLRCRADERCFGRIILRTTSGQKLHSRLTSVKPHSFTTVHMHLSRAQSRQRTLVRIARAQPE
jgi:hypothetical protein